MSVYGFSIFSLAGVYEGHARDALQISEQNTHPSVLGHRLVADKYAELQGKNILMAEGQSGRSARLKARRNDNDLIPVKLDIKRQHE